MNFFLAFLNAVAKALTTMEAHQRKIDATAMREKLLAQKAIENEIRIQQASNKVVATDLEIEIKKLQLLKAQRDLGLNSEEFKPTNYD